MHGCLFIGALAFTSQAGGQQIVHAMTGKVTAVYPASKTIQVDTDDGSQGSFDILTQNVPMTFEKNVKAMTIPASSFNKAAIASIGGLLLWTRRRQDDCGG